MEDENIGIGNDLYFFEEKEYSCYPENNANNSLMGSNKIIWFLNSKDKKKNKTDQSNVRKKSLLSIHPIENY